MSSSKKIVIENGKPPHFDGAWTVGEVLQMAQQLAAWVERLQVNTPTPEPSPNGTEQEMVKAVS